MHMSFVQTGFRSLVVIDHFIENRCLLIKLLEVFFTCEHDSAVQFIFTFEINRFDLRNQKNTFDSRAGLTSPLTQQSGYVWSFFITSTPQTFRCGVRLCFDRSRFLLPSQKNNHHHFPCNENLCRDQRLWNTHTDES